MAEEVDNPQYDFWSAFKAGAEVSHSVSIAQDGRAMDMTVTSTLKSLDENQVVITRSMVFQMEGQPAGQPMQMDDLIPRKIDASKIDPVVAATADPKTKSGPETVKVGDQELACTWYEVNSEQDGKKVAGKVWMSPKMPGGVVKATIDSADGGKINMQAVTFKAAA